MKQTEYYKKYRKIKVQNSFRKDEGEPQFMKKGIWFNL